MSETNRLGCWLDLKRLDGGCTDGFGDTIRETLVNGGKDGNYGIVDIESVKP